MNAGPESARESNPENAALGASPSGFCMGCSYPLTGLSDHRCPECGRSFDPANPRSYRLAPLTRFQVVRRRIAIAGACTVILLGLWLFGIEVGGSRRVCAMCGADSTVRYANILGVKFEYGERIREGPTSRFIQEHTHSKCAHDWYHRAGSFGPLFLHRGCMVGDGTRDMLIQELESFGGPDALACFERCAAANPQFASRFITAVRKPTDDAAFLALIDEIEAMNDDHFD